MAACLLSNDMTILSRCCALNDCRLPKHLPNKGVDHKLYEIMSYITCMFNLCLYHSVHAFIFISAVLCTTACVNIILIH